MHNRYCVIVDPYVCAARICDELIAHQIKPIALLSNMSVEDSERDKRLPKDKFELVLNYNEESVRKLEALNIIRVITGLEVSVAIADELANKFTPQFANPMETSLFRNDKYLMQEALRQTKLNTISQICVDHPHLTAEDKENLAKLKFPLFIKPLGGMASFGARRCDDMQELETGLKGIFGSKPVIGEQVTAVTIQECIIGDEYFVDTVSLLGQHKVTSVFRYRKINYQGYPIYRYIDIVDPYSNEAQVGIAFVKEVLDALQLKNGFAHTEIFLTPNGPYLIELNPRISGAYGFPNKLALVSCKIDQTNLMVDSILHPEQFTRSYNDPPHLSLHGRVVMLQTWQEKNLDQINLNDIQQMPSFQELAMLFPQGSHIKPPTTLTDTVGMLLLAHKDPQVIENDYQRIIAMEREGAIF